MLVLPVVGCAGHPASVEGCVDVWTPWNGQDPASKGTQGKGLKLASLSPGDAPSSPYPPATIGIPQARASRHLCVPCALYPTPRRLPPAARPPSSTSPPPHSRPSGVVKARRSCASCLTWLDTTPRPPYSSMKLTPSRVPEGRGLSTKQVAGAAWRTLCASPPPPPRTRTPTPTLVRGAFGVLAAW